MSALPIIGRPVCLAAVLFLAAAGMAAPQNPPTMSPVRIARDEGLGLLVVTDSRSREIQIFDAALRLVNSFEIEGQPLGVAAADRTILVGNATTHMIEFYDHYGVKLGVLPDYVDKPNDIALDLEERMAFVVDAGAKLVRIHHAMRGRRASPFASQIPLGGPDPLVLATPTAVEVDPKKQEVVVSDFGDAALGIEPRIQIFGYDGALHATISSRFGMLGRRFSRPQGIAIDDGRIFVVDSWVSRVLVFDRATLAQIGSVGTYGTSPGELSLPLDVLVEGTTKDVYVTNNLNGRIELFVGGAR